MATSKTNELSWTSKGHASNTYIIPNNIIQTYAC